MRNTPGFFKKGGEKKEGKVPKTKGGEKAYI